MSTHYLTPEGYEKIRTKIEKLKKKRASLAKAVGEARSHGDISENAEYDAAKEAQGMNEKKIAELEAQLNKAQILDDTNIPKDEALLGATVELEDLDSGEKLTYTLVSEPEADYSQGKISVTSPIGKGLLGHKKDEKVSIEVPAGTLKYKITGIKRAD